MRSLISLRQVLAFGAVVAVVVLGSAVARAGILASDFVRPVSVSAASEYNSARGVVHTIDGSGLNALGQHGTTGDGTMWMTSSGAVPTWIQYDLGVPTTLSGFHLWNFNMVIGANAYTGRGIKDATVQTSMDGVNWSSAAGSYSPFTEASNGTSYAGEDYSFSGPLRARYVRIDGQNAHDGGGYAGLSEIRFTTPNLITGVDATASSVYGDRVGQRTVDGSGMSGFGDERADAGYSTSMWMSADGNTTGTTITFDLQDVHSLQAVRVWNFNGAAGSSLADRGIETFDIDISLDGVTYRTLSGPSSGHFSLTEAPGTADYLTPDMIDLNTVLARYVRFTVVTTHGSSLWAGLSEVRFYEGVPEPSSIVLLGLGLLAVTGFARRNSRRS